MLIGPRVRAALFAVLFCGFFSTMAYAEDLVLTDFVLVDNSGASRSYQLLSPLGNFQLFFNPVSIFSEPQFTAGGITYFSPGTPDGLGRAVRLASDRQFLTMRVTSPQELACIVYPDTQAPKSYNIAPGAQEDLLCATPTGNCAIDCNTDTQFTILRISVGGSLDLGVSQVLASQPGSSVGTDGLLDVAAAQPVNVTVPVSGSGFGSPETRTTTVTLQAGFQPVQTQSISLAAVQSAGILMVPFTVIFDPSVAGTTQTITATVDPGNTLNEINLSNNTTSAQVDVQSRYQLVATVNGTAVPAAGTTVTMPPSILAGAGCTSANVNHSNKPVTIQCIDQSSNQPVEGCTYSLHLAQGGNDGGHSHGGGTRPLVCTPSQCTNLSDVLEDGDTGEIESSGATVTYAAPEIAGDVNLIIAGTDPNGNPLQGPTITFGVQVQGSDAWVPLSNNYANVIINGADNSPSHLLGYYGTPGMADAIQELSDNYVENLIPLASIPPIQSQAASLPWGGLYDADWNGNVDGRILPWSPPHCGHRDGLTIDLSVKKLDAQHRKALQNAAFDSQLNFFFVPESPQRADASHWHATIK